MNVRIAKAQREDSELAKIIPLVTKGKCEGYVMRGDVQFRNEADGIKLILSRQVQTQVIRKIHDQGRFSAGKTEILIQREYWFNRMRSKIEKIIRH